MASFQATASPTPFGVFDSEKDFIIDANAMVTFVKRKLGDDILSVELTNKQVWMSFEEATLEYGRIVNEYQTKSQTYSADAQNQTEVTNQARAKELQGMEQNIQQYQQTAAQDIQQKQADLLRPLIEKAKEAIQKVAREQGFDYVIDATPGGAVILSDGKDLMADVKKELGF